MPNHFDKILKENIQAAIPFISRTLLGFNVGKSEILKDKIQITEEREGDFLQKILHKNPVEDFVLHLEFQTDLNQDPIRRMLLYYAMIFHKYSLPAEQFVFYIGNKPMPLFEAELKHKNANLRYNLIDFRQYKAEQFLDADKPEVIILAILSDFGVVPPVEMLSKIIKKLKSSVNSDLRLKKFIRQLQVLSMLRNLQPILNEIEDLMPLTIDYTQDIYYQTGLKQGVEEGIEKGIKKGIEKGIEKFILRTSMTDNEIALAFEVPTALVKKIRDRMEKK